MENPVNQEAIIDFTDQVNRIADNDSSSLNKRELYLSRILVVDDDPLNVDVLEEILTGSGYSKVVTTTDPLEAVQFYKESNFDLVLLDILMPIMDGFGVMEQFKSMRKKHEVPVLILSALSDQKTRLKALEGGARDYLIKPFNPDEVLVRIRNLLEVRLAQKQLRMHNEILIRKLKNEPKSWKKPGWK